MVFRFFVKRRIYIDALPILVAVKDGMGLHAVCGYNVGSVELLCELLR